MLLLEGFDNTNCCTRCECFGLVATQPYPVCVSSMPAIILAMVELVFLIFAGKRIEDLMPLNGPGMFKRCISRGLSFVSFPAF